MLFSDIQTKARFLTSTNTVSFPLATLTVEANNALDRIVSLIMRSDGRWQFDDANNTDLPIATTAIVANQQDYALTTSHLEITRVELQDTSGNWSKLEPIDQTDVYNQSLTDYLKTAGVPMYYDKLGNSVFLYPKPNYSQSASLKVFFERGPSYFVGDNSSGDNAKVPGFNSLYHDLIPLWIAYNFALASGKENAQTLMAEITLREDSLREDYALRSKDDHMRLRARPYSFK